jgi:hypothetical protein
MPNSAAKNVFQPSAARVRTADPMTAANRLGWAMGGAMLVLAALIAVLARWP